MNGVKRRGRRDGYNQNEVENLFNSIVLPNTSYGLAVYGAAEAELFNDPAFFG